MSRTRLTVAPGEPLVDDRLVRGDRYTPGLVIPAEPTWPGRFRRLWMVSGAAIITAVLLIGFFLLNERGNSFDPALDPERFAPPTTAPSSPG